LSAAVLTTDTRPLILVPKDSTPESVTDFITDYKSVLAGNTVTVYFMGGVNAISAANYTSLTTALTTAGDTTPPTFKRLAGADRYATANLAATQAGIMVAADKLIIVNGDSWADGISAGVMSAEAGWPIVLQTKTGNNASAKKTIDAYLALTSSVKTFIIVGGTGALGTDTESYLINTKAVKPANIIRLSGADRYATSLRVNNYVRTQGAPLNDITGVNTALVSGESPWDALAATSWAAKNNALVQLTPAAGGNASVASLAATYAAVSAASAAAAADYAGQNLFIIGGKTAVPDAVRTGFQSSAANNLTTSLTGCVEGGTSLTLTVSSALTTTEKDRAITDNVGFEFLMKENSGAAGSGATRVIQSASPYDSANAVFTVTTPVQAAADVFKFTGVTEDVVFDGGTSMFERSIGASSCTVANDATAPVVTMTGRNGTLVGNVGLAQASMSLTITSNEPITTPVFSAGDVTCDSSTNQSAMVVTVIKAGLVFVASLADGETTLEVAKTGAGDICSIPAAEFVDRGGLSPAAAITTTLAADSTAPVVSVNAINCVAAANAAITAGGTTFTATAAKAQAGAAGNSYRLTVVNSRGLMQPSFVVDDTAKTIVVTADVGYHTPNDLIAYQTSTGAGGNWTITAGAGLLTATVVAGSSLAGISNCTMNIASNEPIIIASAGVTVSVAGLNAGYISTAPAVTGTASYVAATANSGGLMSRTITFSTKILGAGSIGWASGVTGVSDQNGNNVLIPSTFTTG
jgi:putative cell wall-binding protein